MPQEAYEIHGLTEEFLSDKEEFKDIAEEFLKFIENAELIIHNASFDMKFLNYELGLISKDGLDNFEVIDTLKMSKTIFPGMPSNLDALCRRYRIDISQRIKHGALLDAELLAEVFLEMQGGRQQGMEFIATRQDNKKKLALNKPINYSKNIYKLSDREIMDHKKLIFYLKK